VKLVDDKFIFSAPASFKGPSTFSFTTVDENGEETIHTMTIIVPNKAPVFMNMVKGPNEIFTVSTQSTSLNVTATDPNNDPIKITLGNVDKNFSVSLIGKLLRVKAKSDFSGTLSVPLIVTDNEGASTVGAATFIINPRAPIAAQATLSVSNVTSLTNGLNKLFAFQTVVTVALPSNADGAQASVNGQMLAQMSKTAAGVATKAVSIANKVSVAAMGKSLMSEKSMEVPVSLQGGATVARVNFDNDSWKLTAGAKSILDALALKAAELGLSAFDLVGHADANIGKTSNQTLSTKRASVVANYLSAAMQQLGIANPDLKKSAEAATAPIASNKSTMGLAMNRRVDVVLPQP
jgi:outer membrane protein OmpA-like peptidoglycan-associated protein